MIKAFRFISKTKSPFFAIAFFLLLIISSSQAQMQPPGGSMEYAEGLTPTHAEVAYATTSSAQVLDLFVPEGDGPFPVVVNIHGGGFMVGSKEMLDAPIAQALLENGYAVASLNYRLSGEAIFPAAVQDVKAAVRFLRANAADYKLNPDKIAAFGQSAGGNLASMLGTTGDVTTFDDASLGNEGVSSRVQAVINWFGPNEFLSMDEQAKAQGCAEDYQTHGAADSPESKYLGAEIATVPDLVAQANPITYLSSDDAPTLLQKGNLDCTIPIAQSQLLYDALLEAGIEAEYELLENVGHGDDMNTSTPVFASEENVKRLVEFLDMYLK